MNYAHTVKPEQMGKMKADVMVIPRASEPSHAERSKTLVFSKDEGFLSTIAHRPAGYPFGSVVRFGLNEDGTPLLCLSRLAEHTKNLLHDPKASLMVAEASSSSTDPLALGRVTLVGRLVSVPADRRDVARQDYLEKFPHAYYVDFEDFDFYLLEIEAVRYVGGFGMMSWVKSEDYLRAEPDPMRHSAPDIVEHMNQDHSEALLVLGRAYADIPDPKAAIMTAVDRYGFDVLFETSDGKKSSRIRFTRDITTPDACRVEMISLLHQARKSLGIPSNSK